MHPVTRLYVAGFLCKCAFPVQQHIGEEGPDVGAGWKSLFQKLQAGPPSLGADAGGTEWTSPGMTPDRYRHLHPEWQGPGLRPPSHRPDGFNTTFPNTRMFPQQHHQLTPEQIQMARMTGMALPSVLGATIGGIGSFANGGNPLRGAATGLGTGAGWTLGGMAGNAGAQALGVTDPTMRALIGLGASGAGAFFGNRITGSLVGNKKRRYIEEED